jgi:hypothetical protein
MVSRAFGREFAEGVFGLRPALGWRSIRLWAALGTCFSLEASQVRPFAEVRSQMLEA